MQYGFAGLSAILLAILVWLISKLLDLLEKTNQIISDNTKAICDVDKRTIDELKLLRAIHDKLLTRPCMTIQ